MTSSNDESSHFFTKGLKNSEMRNFDLAIKDFTEAIAMDPANPEAYRNR